MPTPLLLAIDQGTTSTRAVVYDGRPGPRQCRARIDAALPAARLGRARRRGDLAVSRSTWCRGRWPPRRSRPRAARRHRPHQPARDGRAVGARHGPTGGAAPSSGRTAAPPTSAANARPTRTGFASAPAWSSTRTSRPRSCAGCSQQDAAWRGAGRGGPAGVRHHRQLPDLAPDRRPRPRHRPHQRLAHAAVEPATRRAGTTSCAATSSVPAALLPEVRPSAADFGTTAGLGFLPDGVPIRGVAGDQQAALFGQCASRPARRNAPTAPGRSSCNTSATRPTPVAAPPADDAGGQRRRAAAVRPGRQRVRRRGGGAVAARRAAAAATAPRRSRSWRRGRTRSSRCCSCRASSAWGRRTGCRRRAACCSA